MSDDDMICLNDPEGKVIMDARHAVRHIRMYCNVRLGEIEKRMKHFGNYEQTFCKGKIAALEEIINFLGETE